MEGEKGKGMKKEMKMCYIHVGTPTHKECDHYVM